jgi:tight adherence protein C
MSPTIPLLFFAFLMVVITWAGIRFYARPGRYFEQLGTAQIRVGGEATYGPGIAVRIVREIGRRVPISPEEATMTRRLLIAAGHRENADLAFYYGLRVLSVIGCLLVAVLLQSRIDAYPLRMVAFVVATVAGLFIPGMILEHLVDRRQEVLRLSLPDALDLMVVCVEAGLGLDQAILNVSNELALTHPQICEELSLVTLEMQAGKRRADSLRNLAARTGEPELRKLVSILVQTDRFGTSIAESLRTHSDFMRIRRRQDAEERAGKVGVKLVFPIFFCILPAMLVVVAGPGVLQLFKQLFPMMQRFREGA